MQVTRQRETEWDGERERERGREKRESGEEKRKKKKNTNRKTLACCQGNSEAALLETSACDWKTAQGAELW